MIIREQAYRYQSLIGQGVQASCRDVDCEKWRVGWVSVLDESTANGSLLAGRVRALRGYVFEETRTDTGLTRFVFAPGQSCGQDHEIRPGIFLHRTGDERPNVVEGERWIDGFRDISERINQAKKEG